MSVSVCVSCCRHGPGSGDNGAESDAAVTGPLGLVLSFDFFPERGGIGANLRGPFRFQDHFLGPVKSSSRNHTQTLTHKSPLVGG